MRWFIIVFVVFIIIFGMIGSAIERRRDEEFRGQTTEQLSKLAEWWYCKNKK